MQTASAAIGSILAALSAIPYILGIVRGQTHPNLVTWLTWTLLNGIITVAAFSTGAIPTALLGLAITAGTGTILALSVKRGVKKFTALDIACLAAALLGIIAWRVTRNPFGAVLIAEAVVLIAAVPTWRHAWVKPWEETWEGFGMAVVAGLFTFAGLTTYTFISLAPVIIFFGNSLLIVAIILGRRRVLSPSVPSPRA